MSAGWVDGFHAGRYDQELREARRLARGAVKSARWWLIYWGIATAALVVIGFWVAAIIAGAATAASVGFLVWALRCRKAAEADFSDWAADWIAAWERVKEADR